MNVGRMAAISRKEFLQVRRDPRSLLIALFMPIMMLGLLGYGVRLDAKHVPIYVFDRDGSQDSQALLKRFQASDYFQLARVVDNYAEIIGAIDAGRCKLGLVIPPDFARRLHAGGRVPIQGIVDATDDNTANLAIEPALRELPRYLGARGLRCGRITPIPLSLEDVFVQKVGRETPAGATPS